MLFFRLGIKSHWLLSDAENDSRDFGWEWQNLWKEQLHPNTIVIAASCYTNGNLYFWPQGLFYSETELNAYAEFLLTVMKPFPFLLKRFIARPFPSNYISINTS